jgi:hypothetical protein
MALLVYVLLLALSCVGVFIATHMGPLNEDQIVHLATQRRNRYLANYFDFFRYEPAVNAKFKSNLKADGKFYNIKVPLAEWPSTAAALLKGKKHEWSIVAFERQQEIVLIWANKGPNKRSVPIKVSAEEMIARSRELQCTSILLSHNHPNPNPRQENHLLPSDADERNADYFIKQLCPAGLNFLDFVFERGMFLEFARAYAETFAPLRSYCLGIKSLNNQSDFGNLLLHLERVFRIGPIRAPTGPLPSPSLSA